MALDVGHQSVGETGDPSIDCKLFIGGLAYTTTDAQLTAFYEQWGEVVDSIVMRDPSGRSRGFGFVTFRSLDQLESCLKGVPHFLDGKTVDPKRATPKGYIASQIAAATGEMGPLQPGSFKTSGPEIADPSYAKLFIGGLAYTTSVEQLREYYLQFGDLVNAIVMKDMATGRSRGFGFVTYKTVTMVDNAMNNRPHVIDNKTVDPKRALPKEICDGSESNYPTRRLCVGNLSKDVSEQYLRDYFGIYGRIVHVDMQQDPVHTSRHVSYIQFNDHDPVDRIMLSGPHLLGGFEVKTQKNLGKDEQRKVQQHERDRAERDGRSRAVVATGRGDGGWQQQQQQSATSPYSYGYGAGGPVSWPPAAGGQQAQGPQAGWQQHPWAAYGYGYPYGGAPQTGWPTPPASASGATNSASQPSQQQQQAAAAAWQAYGWMPPPQGWGPPGWQAASGASANPPAGQR